MTEVKALPGPPESLDVLVVLPFGYPAHALGQGKKERTSLGEVAHRERLAVCVFFGRFPNRSVSLYFHRA